MSRARILIADDHQILAEGLRSLLEPEFEVVCIVANGRELVAAARKLRPDVVVADVSMPSLGGIEAAAQLRDHGIATKVVFLTQHQEAGYARRAMEAGAVGYVLKHAASTELVSAIREALRGHSYVSPMIATELFDLYRQRSPSADDRSIRLTTRQRELLQLFAEGHSAKEVAAVVKISTRTAEFHKARILKTLGLETTAQLVQYAIRHGIISV
jgi:DNA-binding NarL/FixJ family response regulator